ncbi:DUF1345 domain-containing protein [Streptomyces exfoliatus]|uniref:DUF1345 domain-containing protein n=1 Tax=Streptomyces exfoliatus TaxID=1905 RepID=A0ABV3CRW5_STREX
MRATPPAAGRSPPWSPSRPPLRHRPVAKGTLLVSTDDQAAWLAIVGGAASGIRILYAEVQRRGWRRRTPWGRRLARRGRGRNTESARGGDCCLRRYALPWRWSGFPGTSARRCPRWRAGRRLLVLVIVAWISVVIAFAVAFHADDLLEVGEALEFPGGEEPVWGDYVYFAPSVMTTFGTTGVTALSPCSRRARRPARDGAGGGIRGVAGRGTGAAGSSGDGGLRSCSARRAGEPGARVAQSAVGIRAGRGGAARDVGEGHRSSVCGFAGGDLDANSGPVGSGDDLAHRRARQTLPLPCGDAR